MARVLFLSHRLPYPPNKGDKVRSFNVLQHLLSKHQVLLGTFVDDLEDEQHLAKVSAWCDQACVRPLRPYRGLIKAAAGLLSRQSLAQAYYADAALHAWVRQLRQSDSFDLIWAYSSTMYQYAAGSEKPLVMDFADVESQKWAEYGRTRSAPMSWVYGREGRHLLDVERRAAAQARHALFATDQEASAFRQLVPQHAHKVSTLRNGVDSAYFAPDPARASPFAPDEVPLVFCGTMDYWPNVDAVLWFVEQVMPRLDCTGRRVRLHVVGRNPVAAVTRLRDKGVVVTGTVADVRPYMQHAAVMLAPIRLARGIQNKVLEAMSMGKAVVTTTRCVAAIDASADEHFLVADEATDCAAELQRLMDRPALAQRVGAAARQRIVERFTWASCLTEVDSMLDQAMGRP